jgi:hypothetical protein
MDSLALGLTFLKSSESLELIRGIKKDEFLAIPLLI